MLAYYGSGFNCVIAVLVWYQPSALAGGVVKLICYDTASFDRGYMPAGGYIRPTKSYSMITHCEQ